MNLINYEKFRQLFFRPNLTQVGLLLLLRHCSGLLNLLCFVCHPAGTTNHQGSLQVPQLCPVCLTVPRLCYACLQVLWLLLASSSAFPLASASFHVSPSASVSSPGVPPAAESSLFVTWMMSSLPPKFPASCRQAEAGLPGHHCLLQDWADLEDAQLENLEWDPLCLAPSPVLWAYASP